MTEERRISLAELLAREGGAPAPAGGRRRRHRGGEDSITVAELTGEIPVIRDAPRAEPAAEAVEADEPAVPVVEAVEVAPEPVVESEPVAEPVEVAEAEVVEAEVVTEHHTTEGRAQQDFAWSRWDQAEAPIMATADFNTAQVRERQARLAEVEGDDTVDVAPVTDLPKADEAAPDTAALSAEQIDEARAQHDELPSADEPIEDPDTDADTDAEPGRAKGWLALAAEVLVGVAAGAGLFYGFFKLWNWRGGMATIGLTVVLAFIVIIGIVTFTHYLRKTTDFLTLGLALLVGLVITFGPLLMALATN